ncbi:hypothetical protein SOCE26_020930 [Sorangium cellulosum]|uniref:Uncharacterized protein n=1 Tax=Sorangium cellulosum TaxID=56 RepID=A0A2L0EN60_SORCE|nr:DUF5995 family protein [Sorangium cellulosum]AUX40692.1 hypothetical protein SOCE26_020930 [Sorangium cellulosum]
MKPANVAEALVALETVAARLRERNDPRAVFPDVYAVITRRVKEAVVDGRDNRFLEPAWISRLAGIFCEYYLKALEASLDGRSTGIEAWDVAFECNTSRGTAAAVHALLGINAHINYDLALGLCQNIVQHGAAQDARLLRRYRHDHDLVNEILAAAMPEIFEVLTRRYGCPLARIATFTKDVQRAVSSTVLFMLRGWRDRVWDDLLCLLAARSEADRRAVLAGMNRHAGKLARMVATGNGALRAGEPLFRTAAVKLALAA